MIRYPIRTPADGARDGVPASIAGPELRLRRRALREAALSPARSRLEIGAKVLIEGTGAYTTTYSAVGFNGFPPLEIACDLSRALPFAERVSRDA